MDHPLVTQVRETCRANALFTEGDEIIVAVSGGQDSVAMLHALGVLSESFGIRLRAAHFNHMLRGAASDADADYVARLAAELQVPLRSGRADVRETARRRRLTIHEAARHERHAFLESCAAELGAAAIALGHTSDDVAETMLLNIFRGCSLEGLAPLPPRSGSRVRPLVDVPRSATAQYCRAMGLRVRTDSSNADIRYARSRIRGELLPQIEAYWNPATRKALLRLAQFAREDEATLSRMANDAAEKHLHVESDMRAWVDQAELLALERSVQRRLAMRMLDVLGVDLSAGAWAVREALHFAATGVPGSWVLPGGALLEVRAGRVSAKAATLETCWPSFEQPIPVGGSVILPFGIGVLRAAIEPIVAPPIRVEPFRAAVPVQRVVGRLRARTCRSDDRFAPLGLGSSKRVLEYLADRRVSRDDRARTLVLCDDAGVLWVIGHGIDERARVSETPVDAVVLWVESALGPSGQEVCHTNMPYQQPLEA